MDFERNFSYFQWKDELREHFNWYCKRSIGVIEYWDEFVRKFEIEWLETNSQYQGDERLRFCVIFPLIELEIKLDLLSPELREEFELYYEDYQEGKLDSLFKSQERTMIDFDFKFCNLWKDKNYNDRSVDKIKYYKLHTDERARSGAEKTFKSIPLSENDVESQAITIFAHQLLGTPLSDGYNPGDENIYTSRKREFEEWYEKEKNSKRVSYNIAERILNYKCSSSIKENGMCRFIYTVIAVVKQIENNDITVEMLHTVKWAIEAFETEDYKYLFDDEDYLLLKEDIDFIKDNVLINPDLFGSNY